jgi:hypothetical protein
MYLERNSSFKRTEIKKNINFFLSQICNCIHKALSPEAIQKGFRTSFVCNAEYDIPKLENSINDFIQRFKPAAEVNIPVLCYNYLFLYC